MIIRKSWRFFVLTEGQDLQKLGFGGLSLQEEIFGRWKHLLTNLDFLTTLPFSDGFVLTNADINILQILTPFSGR